MKPISGWMQFLAQSARSRPLTKPSLCYHFIYYLIIFYCSQAIHKVEEAEEKQRQEKEAAAQAEAEEKERQIMFQKQQAEERRKKAEAEAAKEQEQKDASFLAAAGDQSKWSREQHSMHKGLLTLILTNPNADRRQMVPHA